MSKKHSSTSIGKVYGSCIGMSFVLLHYCNDWFDVFFRLNSNLDVASRVNAEVVVKPEPATLGELFSYMNQASSKVL